MKEEICAEYAMGLCPYEAFYIASLTKQCNKSHRPLEGYELPEKVSKLKKAAAATYCKILKEASKRIYYNTVCLKRLYAETEIKKAITHSEMLIERYNREESSSEDLHTLLILHGAMLEADASTEKLRTYTVCQNCGALNATDKYNHSFCLVYKKIRVIAEELKE